MPARRCHRASRSGVSRLRRLPAEILAFDWGSTPAKRQLCRAVLRDGRYVLSPPRPVTDVAALELGPGVLAAFDCPIGVSSAYAAMAGLGSFRAALGMFGRGRFERFYEPADGRGRHHDRAALLSGSGREGDEARPSPERARRGGVRGARVRSAGRRGADLLAGRSAPGGPIRRVCLARAHRAATRPHRALALRWAPRRAAGVPASGHRGDVSGVSPAHTRGRGRAQVGARGAGRLRSRAAPPSSAGTRGSISTRCVLCLRGGFGGSSSGEDPFDATIACIALARLLLDDALPEPPEAARAVEGWILGLPGDRL